jgi:hypothetical protein
LAFPRGVQADIGVVAVRDQLNDRAQWIGAHGELGILPKPPFRALDLSNYKTVALSHFTNS